MPVAVQDPAPFLPNPLDHGYGICQEFSVVDPTVCINVSEHELLIEEPLQSRVGVNDLAVPVDAQAGCREVVAGVVPSVLEVFVEIIDDWFWRVG